ncbi:MAG TPA: hypothetical protein VLJ39_13860 [Tepidisphaeraceae bacterium]|nr:hypothetical protein [Tepidisphaeraceae bacterium]
MEHRESHPDQCPAPRPDSLLVRAMLARLKAGRDLRRAKVERVKDAILANEYENMLKLDVAADRVIDAIRAVSR